MNRDMQISSLFGVQYIRFVCLCYQQTHSRGRKWARARVSGVSVHARLPMKNGGF